jgi:hypothetical protein
MTPDANALRRESAQRDLEDIMNLKKSEPFQRYWMRRLKQRRDALAEEQLRGKLTIEEREQKRAIVNEYDEIAKWLAVDESTARREVMNLQ